MGLGGGVGGEGREDGGGGVVVDSGEDEGGAVGGGFRDGEKNLVLRMERC